MSEQRKLCEGCRRPIVMVQRPQTKKWVPVEPEPIRAVRVCHADPKDPTPTFALLLDDGKVVVRCRRWRGLETDTATPLIGRILHFSTCPEANEFRRPQSKKGHRHTAACYEDGNPFGSIQQLICGKEER